MRAAAALAALLAGATATAGAETLYVTDRLQLGVHAERTLESTIVKVIPSGTPLEVLTRDGSFVQVETDDGLVGWVDGTYLDEEKPAARLIEEMRLAASEQADALESSRERVAELETRLDDEIERAGSAEERLAAVQAELDGLRRAAEERAAQRRAADPPPEAPVPNATLRDVQRLAEENRALKQRLAEVEAEQRMHQERARADPTRAPAAPRHREPHASHPYASLLTLERWHWLLFGSVVLLALATGAHLVDWRVRRRHGGFRV